MRVFNFAAGPATLPLEVLQQAQAEMTDWKSSGMSVMEVSHRSKAFIAVAQEAEADLRELLNVPANYKVLFLQGGASLQFSMVPMNLLPEGGSADYVVTGSWSQKAVKEAKRHGKVSIAATTEGGNFVRVQDAGEIKWDPNAAYAHVTSNNTIFGTQFQVMPDSGAVPLVCDASFLTEELLAQRFAASNDPETVALWSKNPPANEEIGALLDKLDLAATEFQRSLAIEEKALGPKHPQVSAPLLGLGEVELSRKAPARAVPLLERALAIRASQPGDGVDLADVRFALARALFATGDRSRARALATEARDAYAKVGPRARRELAEASAWLNSHP